MISCVALTLLAGSHNFPAHHPRRPAVAAAVTGGAHRRRYRHDRPIRRGVQDRRQGHERHGWRRRSRRAASARHRRKRRLCRPRGARMTRSSSPRRPWTMGRPPAAGAAHPAVLGAVVAAVPQCVARAPEGAVPVAVPAVGARRGWRRAAIAAVAVTAAAAAAATAAAADGWWQQLGATGGFEVPLDYKERLICASGRRRGQGEATCALRSARGTSAVQLWERPFRRRPPATLATCRRRYAGGGTRPDRGPALLPPGLGRRRR